MGNILKFSLQDTVIETILGGENIVQGLSGQISVC